MDHYVVVVSGGRCLACDAKLRPVSLPAGGKYWVCAADLFKGCGWYISWTAETDTGRQVRIVAKAA